MLELDVVVPGAAGAAPEGRGPCEPPPDGCPITGLWPCSAAPAAVPLLGNAALGFSDTRADRFPPGMAGPLKT